MNPVAVVVGAWRFICANWKMLCLLFALGGTVTVVGVIPGTEGAAGYIEGHIDAAKTKLVSATTPE